MKQTIRVRLTVLYTSLFLIMAGILLTVTNLTLGNTLQRRVSDIAHAPPPTPQRQPLPLPPPKPEPELRPPDGPGLAGDVRELPADVVESQWAVTGFAVVGLTLVAAFAAWWLTGRMLRPLRDITATARRLSLSNLHERISATGPRDELKHLADTFDAMLARLERSVESQRLFIANAAHELRTPLATQRAAIQIGLADPDDLPAVRETLLTHNRRTERLIDSLLVLAQAEHGLETSQPVAIDALVRQVAADMPPSDVTLTLDLEPATVAGDPVLINRMLVNLVENAFRHNIPAGSVHIGLTNRVLTVRNTGPYVPAERVAELFEPFRQMQSRTGGGAGLGLSIVLAIAHAHRATVWARSDPDGGLELTVRFAASTIPGTVDPAAAS